MISKHKQKKRGEKKKTYRGHSRLFVQSISRLKEIRVFVYRSWVWRANTESFEHPLPVGVIVTECVGTSLVPVLIQQPLPVPFFPLTPPPTWSRSSQSESPSLADNRSCIAPFHSSPRSSLCWLPLRCLHVVLLIFS